jgi:hypothetical protein
MRNARNVARRLGCAAEAVCRCYLPSGRRLGRYWIVGDVFGTPGRSLYVRLTGTRAGKWTDAATGEHGDLLDLIALNRDLDFRAALDEAETFLRLAAALPDARSAEPPAPAGSSEAARRLFAASQPLSGTLAEVYLKYRGIVLPPDVRALRFHPRCYYLAPSGREIRPALIAAVTDLDGHITGVHRTWLDPSGCGKAPVDQPRRAMGELVGNGVRFGPANDVLVAAEGIETTLALTTTMPAMPALAALSAAHLAAVLFPAGLRRLYVARDNDAAGCRAQEKLTMRGRQAGIDIRALVPKAGDFNADLLAFAPDRLRIRIAEQLVPEDADRFLQFVPDRRS